MEQTGWRAEAREVRRAIDRLGPRGRTERLPGLIRERVLRCVATGRAQGASWHAVGEAVGLSATTLQRWQACVLAPMPTRALVPVRVEADGSVVEGRESSIVLHSPRGWRVEGLAVSSAIDILRALA